MTIAQGTILAGTSTVPDLDQAVRAYCDILGLDLVETGRIAPPQADSWDCPATAQAAYALLRPASGAPCWFRLVEQPAHADFIPTTSYGWAAFECAVADAHAWPERLPGELFEVRGLPRTPGNLEPTFIAMQTLGPGREMLYLNQVLNQPADTDLPEARSPIDRIFIVVLAASDRGACIAWYGRHLGLAHAADHTLAYSMINIAFAHPADHQTTLSMMHNGRMPVVEIDGYPDLARPRPRHPGMLPPGNALVSLAVSDLDACGLDWLAPPQRLAGPLYDGRRSATAIGPAGELLECIETG
ncbi:hypothetical protein MACH24_09410 [Erythrobacter sp. Dej080120_24]|uniref:hypothetical protein n=1 Tax=Erythrobacter sp. Dej080120_24 TaxID=3024837 RepID=UPI002926924B|nr:hypothetical protein MACH24_09410 [Erythrobacter sp. Dej080120_24]